MTYSSFSSFLSCYTDVNIYFSSSFHTHICTYKKYALKIMHVCSETNWHAAHFLPLMYKWNYEVRNYRNVKCSSNEKYWKLVRSSSKSFSCNSQKCLENKFRRYGWMYKLVKSLQVRDITFAAGKSCLISLVQVCTIAIKNSQCAVGAQFLFKSLR